MKTLIQKKIYSLLSTKKSVDTSVLFPKTSDCSTLSVMGFVLTVLQISSEVDCGLPNKNEVPYESFLQNYGKHENYEETVQQTITSSDYSYSQCLKDKATNKNQYERYVFLVQKTNE